MAIHVIYSGMSLKKADGTNIVMNFDEFCGIYMRPDSKIGLEDGGTESHLFLFYKPENRDIMGEFTFTKEVKGISRIELISLYVVSNLKSEIESLQGDIEKARCEGKNEKSLNLVLEDIDELIIAQQRTIDNYKPDYYITINHGWFPEIIKKEIVIINARAIYESKHKLKIYEVIREQTNADKHDSETKIVEFKEVENFSYSAVFTALEQIHFSDLYYRKMKASENVV